MSPSDNQTQESPSLVLIYDGECPFCSNYVHMLRLKSAVGKVTMVNARDGGEYVDKATQMGFDLDEGMVLLYGDNWHHGADCIHILSLLSARSGLANRFWAWIFKSSKRARFLYPILRFGRNTTLKAMGRTKIHP